MNKWIALPLAALLALAGVVAASADYIVKDGAGATATFKATGTCTSVVCIPVHELVNSSGTEIGTSGAPIRMDPTGTTTQPVSVTSVPTHAVTQSGTWTVQPGNTANTTPWLVQQSSDYPSSATAITASATGTTAATTATLANAIGKTTYICSLSIRSNATAAATGNATVTGTITATMNYTHWTAPLASGVGVTEQIFAPCVPASTTNTAIAVVSPAPGSGGVVSVTASGYQL